MASTVWVEVRGNVLVMTLSNPEARNAATLEMAEAMAAALDELDRNPALQGPHCMKPARPEARAAEQGPPRSEGCVPLPA